MNTNLNVRISVRGRLGPRTATAFDGLTPARCAGATELVGQVTDQAQLHGVLSRIRDLGLELESVTVTSAEPIGPGTQASTTGDST